MEIQELAVVSSTESKLSATDIRKQVNLIQNVMEAVMKEGEHYGKIPGCGDKKSLFKSGAEKLAMTFRLGMRFTEIDGSAERDDFINYKINCELFHIPTGNVVGNGRGTCNSREKKYRTRMVYANKATAEEKAIGKEEERTGNNGSYKVYVIPQDPWDVQNTLYKMACKRASVAAVINATGASDIFTQDIEDLPEGTVHDEGNTSTSSKPKVDMPKEKKDVAYADIITLSQGKKGDVMNVAGYAVSVSHKQFPQKNDKTKMTDVSTYLIADLPKDPTVQTTIKVFGMPIDAGAGVLLKFIDVTIGEYKGASDFMAKSVSI